MIFSPSVNGHHAAAQRGEHADVGGADEGPRGEHLLARPHVLAGVADVLPELGGDPNPQAIPLALGVLLKDHRVRSGRAIARSFSE